MFGFIWVIGSLATGYYAHKRNKQRAYVILATLLCLIASPFVGFPLIWLHIKSKKSDDADVESQSTSKSIGKNVFWVIALVLLGILGYASIKTGEDLIEAAEERNADYQENADRTLEPAETLMGKGKKRETKGKWGVSFDQSAMDDSKEVTLILNAENTAKAWLKTVRPSLIIRCRENETDLYVNTKTQLHVENARSTYTVRIRLDDGKPFSQTWGGSTSGEAIFARQAISLAKKMVQADKMLFEFTPYNANPAQVTFDLKGIDMHLPKVADACNWSY